MRAVNLIPGEQRMSTSGVPGRSQGGAYAVIVLLVGLALLAYTYGHAKRQASSRTTQLASLTAKAQQAQAAATGLAPYTNFVALREERERAVSQLVDSRFDWPHAFREIGRVLPPKASISSIDGNISGSTPGAAPAPSSASASSASASSASKPAASSGTSGPSSSTPASSSAGSATPPGSVPTITVSGCATSQAEVAITLNRLRLIDGVSEVTLQNSSKSGAGASASGASGQCPPNDPAFVAALTFSPLPAAGVSAASASSSGGAR